MRPLHCLLSLVLFFSVVAFLAGCSSSVAKTEPSNDVKGKIQYRGQPLPEGSIQFTGAGDKVSIRREVAVKNGQYEMSGSEGLPPGSYNVQISGQPLGPTAEPAKVVVPPKYNTQSKLTAVIVAGKTNVVDFTLD
jgi:hypothetical protein